MEGFRNIPHIRNHQVRRSAQHSWNDTICCKYHNKSTFRLRLYTLYIAHGRCHSSTHQMPPAVPLVPAAPVFSVLASQMLSLHLFLLSETVSRCESHSRTSSCGRSVFLASSSTKLLDFPLSFLKAVPIIGGFRHWSVSWCQGFLWLKIMTITTSLTVWASWPPRIGSIRYGERQVWDSRSMFIPCWHFLSSTRANSMRTVWIFAVRA